MQLRQLINKSVVFGISVALLIPNISHAFAESATIQNFVGRQAFLPLIKPSWGNFILHTIPLNKLYSLRGYKAMWVGEDGKPNELAAALKSTFLLADRHGLNPGDYWDADVEKLYNAALTNPNNWITFELAASEAVIRYATHLSVGRFDPQQVDTDIKFKKKEFTDYTELQKVIENGSGELMSHLDGFAPSLAQYQDLVEILAQLRKLKEKEKTKWQQIKSPGIALKLGVKSPVIQQLRDRLNDLGYAISNAGGNLFDAEFETVLKSFQAANGLIVDGTIGLRSQVLRNLNFSLAQRILQVAVNLEKLRWLPKQIEQRHIFVNLATTEFRLQDQGGEVFHFNTVNGHPLHRTPSMRDQITYVNLNPTWTIPANIAAKETLLKLQSDAKFLQKHDMLLLDANTEEEVDPTNVDWSLITSENFPYVIRQNPSPGNSLGVVKFPLQNPWAIYMHDTNERHLFAESDRHYSHGCVRLQKPLELAAYLLNDQPDWSFDAIKAFVPEKIGEKPKESERSVHLTNSLPVYFMYLTVEKSKQGAIRFVDDVYGQDYRLSKALANIKIKEMKGTEISENAANGTLRVEGTAGRFQIFQRVRAIRCDLSQRGVCDDPVVFELNNAQPLLAGDYLVGFENSIYPNIVHIQAGQAVNLKLEKIKIPSSVVGKKIRVYRDFTDVAEQNKILQEMFVMNRHFNRLEKDNFGDLYESGSWERDFVQRFTYEACKRIKTETASETMTPEAQAVCMAWNKASSAQDLSPLFQFNADGSFQEFWVTYPVDVISSRHPRYLVSAPMTNSDFVSVFAGAYKVQAEGVGSRAISVKVGDGF